MSWQVVIHFGMPFAAEVDEPHGRIIIPFDMSERAARDAAGNIRITVEQDRPVIAGTIEKEDNDEETTALRGPGRALPGTGGMRQQ